MIIDISDEHSYLTKEEKKIIEQLLNYIARIKQIPKQAEVSLAFITNEEMKILNKTYRHINKPTDVLSFPYTEFDWEINQFAQQPSFILGEIIVSINQAEAQAEAYNHSIMRELAFLIVHGFLHLVGYTHDTKETEREMFALQEKILREFGLERT